MNALVSEVLEAVAEQPLRRMTIDVEFADPPKPLPEIPAQRSVVATSWVDGVQREPFLPCGRFIKIGADGALLPADAPHWIAVRDLRTDLEWAVESSDERLSWSKADAYARGLSLVGRNDWRLPTIRELLSLVDYDRHDPAIDVALFPGTQSSWYWTSSPWAGSPADGAWIVSFYGGGADGGHRGGGGFVRAVRSVSRAPAGQ